MVFDVLEYYNHSLNEEKEPSVAMIRSLTEFVRQSTAPTMSEFMINMSQVKDTLQQHLQKSVGMLAGHDLFMAFFTHCAQEFGGKDQKRNFRHFKDHVLDQTKLILERIDRSQLDAAHVGARFINDNSILLIPEPCPVIMQMLEYAVNVQHKRFKVLIAEGGIEGRGRQVVEKLQTVGIPCRIILDAAIGYMMDKVDMIFVGAEGVVENGGVINQIGTYQMALVAKTLGKPVYVVTESYKFVRVYPLNQYDLPSITPEIVKFTSRRKDYIIEVDDIVNSNPSVDYTPPQYLTLLLTDLGELTPSGVSDELIKLYL
ncbi:uncharacterized protein BX664DRAFT_329651 [Halteromyces radiatus]|uniref:uncharacterized protein n=1 Tax=Halteromyces radiatus TaxID=101107 RepID=UPI00221E4942|nr:uncharacterized protein BX664DRAFT_329651 [Halteromyces radiatus]KAI8093411.1 hypothetical protein BX664DRAFT_329651 [Halteromyces radiatus]